MKELLLDLEKEITNGQENARKIKELYQLLSSYNAYNILLLKVKQEYKRKIVNMKQYYSDSNCYKNQIHNLFSLFKSDEYLTTKLLSKPSSEDMLFLIDRDTLLQIKSYDIITSPESLSNINYKLLRINNCVAKVYNQTVYQRDPYYCTESQEDKEAFGLFYNKSLITQSYVLDSRFRDYDNIDIREILKVQSLDDIHEKITESKKVKELVLTK